MCITGDIHRSPSPVLIRSPPPGPLVWYIAAPVVRSLALIVRPGGVFHAAFHILRRERKKSLTRRG